MSVEFYGGSGGGVISGGCAYGRCRHVSTFNMPCVFVVEACL